MEPELTISITSHGHGALLARLLRSIREWEDDGALEIIVTENLGAPLDFQDRRAGSHIRVLRNPHPLGLARNHNQAFRHTRTPFFCVINPDVVLIEPVFERMIERMQSERLDIAAPLILDPRGAVLDSFRRLPTPLELVWRWLSRAGALPGEVPEQELVFPDWIAGTLLIIRSEAYAALGGMDEGYQLYFEDVDFCTRARLAGRRLAVDTRLRVFHEPRRDSRRKMKYLFWHLNSAQRFFSSPTYREAKRQRRGGYPPPTP